jgi:hypothetical protein
MVCFSFQGHQPAVVLASHHAAMGDALRVTLCWPHPHKAQCTRHLLEALAGSFRLSAVRSGLRQPLKLTNHWVRFLGSPLRITVRVSPLPAYWGHRHPRGNSAAMATQDGMSSLPLHRIGGLAMNRYTIIVGTAVGSVVLAVVSYLAYAAQGVDLTHATRMIVAALSAFGFRWC